MIYWYLPGGLLFIIARMISPINNRCLSLLFSSAAIGISGLISTSDIIVMVYLREMSVVVFMKLSIRNRSSRITNETVNKK